MIRLAADQDFNNRILRGLRRRSPDVDAVRARDAGLAEGSDPTILEWAASEGRVLLTHDANTMTAYAYERVAAGLPMPGVFLVRQGMTVAQAIDELLVIAECSLEGEWEGQVCFLPL